MKRMLFISCAVVTVFIAVYSFAQMGGQQKEGMGSSQMRGGQMMSQDMMTSMTEMMKQMNGIMERLAHPMHHMTVTDHTQMNELGKVMRKMASEMNEMAVHMGKGEMDAAAAKKMQDRMKTINQEIETLQNKNK
jgi:hypothetical protein